MAHVAISRAGDLPLGHSGLVSCTILWLAASYGSRLREYRHQAGSWQWWELRIKHEYFFQPQIYDSHWKVQGREERILIQMMSCSCGLQHI